MTPILFMLFFDDESDDPPPPPENVYMISEDGDDFITEDGLFMIME